MAIAPVLKTGVRKGMGVRIPRSPPLHLRLGQVISISYKLDFYADKSL